MAKVLRAILKWTLIAVVIAAVVVGGYFLVQWRRWPDWSLGVLLAGFGMVVLLLALARYFLNRSRERAFIKNIVREDDKHLAALGNQGENLIALREQWLRAVDVLRRSNMRLRGNPLYVLPWYMVFGESESGKSSMIANARLTSIASDAGPCPGISATRHCDWWFFNDAIVIDTAGRYAVPVERDRDSEEWETFLTLLSKYRRREPLNGLVATISSERLIAGHAGDLAEYGAALRKRIDHLMRALGTRVPIYVMVAKIDKLHGVDELIARMTEDEAMQCAGVLNPVEQGPDFHPADVARGAVQTIAERLSALHLTLLRDRNVPSSGFQATGEISALEEGLATFVKALFHRNPYMESPLFRGLFFSSARQCGPRSSLLLNDISTFQNRENPSREGQKSVFLHDLFSKILPKDRYVGRKILKYIGWRHVTQNIIHGAWIMGVVFACGLLSMSYVAGRKTLREAATVRSREALREDRDAVFLHLMNLYEDISTIEKMNAERIIPFLWLNQPVKAVEALKRDYSRRFRTHLLDRDIERYQKMVENNSGHNLYGFRADLRDLIWLTATMKYDLEAGFFLSYVDDKTHKGFNPAADWRDREIYPILLRAYLQWNDHPLQAKTAYENLRALSVEAMRKVSRSGVNWIVDWVNADDPSHAVNLDAYWTGSGEAPRDAFVPPAYTIKGYDEIKAFLRAVRGVVGEGNIGGEIDEFWSWYRREWTNAWIGFIRRFDDGWSILKARSEISATSAAIGEGEGPYLRFFADMDHQFSSVFQRLPKRPKGDSLAGRIEFLHKVANVASRLEEREDPGQSGFLKRVMTGLREGQVTNTERLLAAAGLWKRYMATLRALGDGLRKPGGALSLASLHYGRSTGASGSGGRQESAPYAKAETELRKFRLGLGWPENADTQDLFALLGGPLRFLAHDATVMAAGNLQSIWTQDVLARVGGSHDWDMASPFKPGAPIQTFIANVARPFLIPGVHEWTASSWNGRTFPFTSRFLRFLHAGQESLKLPDAKRFAVTIETRPIDVNDSAAVGPQSASLKLECLDAAQTLANFNYTNRATFYWTPESCGRARLRIAFPNFELLHDYPGKSGFLDFLTDFRDGARIFRAADFQDRKGMLEAVGVDEITLAYNIKGAEEPLLLSRRKSLKAPRFIVRSDTMPGAYSR